MKTYLPIAGSALAGMALTLVAFYLPQPWGLPVAAAAGVILATGLTWADLREAQATIDRLLLLTPAEMTISILRPDLSQVCTAEEATRRREAASATVNAIGAAIRRQEAAEEAAGRAVERAGGQ